MSPLESLFEELKTLPPLKLQEAANYIHRLHASNQLDRHAALNRSTTILSDEDGAELERIIEEGCEKIDARDW